MTPPTATQPPSSPQRLRIQTLDPTTPEADWKSATAFCNEVYTATYGTHWVVRPDLLFVAHDNQGPVATGGLELGRLRPAIDSERYFQLSPSMRNFIADHRDEIAEFGRFTCQPRASVVGSRAVLHAALTQCRDLGIRYLFAWARPEVAAHGATNLGVPFWALDVPLDEDTIRSCRGWREPPVEFFFGRSAPRLLLAIVPFFDYVIDRLDLALENVLILETLESEPGLPPGRSKRKPDETAVAGR